MCAVKRESNNCLRHELAQSAAQYIADGTAESFAGAKRKAADVLGVTGSRNMPDNREVQTALLTHLALFEGEIYHQRIAAMRKAALAAMHVFERFQPRLVGPVLYGTACDYSPVTLHLYCDEFERVTRFLHDRDIDYQLTHVELMTAPKVYETFSAFLTKNQGIDFDLVVLPCAFYSHPPLSSLDRRPYKRADTKYLEDLLNENDRINPVVDSQVSDSGIR